MDLRALTERLERGGFVAAGEEAEELLAAAAGDAARLDALLARRLTGEPLAWITGTAPFCGLMIRVDPGVYVPRWQSEPLALRAVERLPADGVAIDLCTGCGAIAKTLMVHRPGARVVAADIDERAVACARANGVEAYAGDLFAPLAAESWPRTWSSASSPTSRRPTCRCCSATRSRSRRRWPTTAATRHRLPAARHRRGAAPPAPGGALLLELGGRQADALDLAGYSDVAVVLDEDGDVRGIEATLNRD